MNRLRIIEKLRTLGVVLLVSVLVWLFAEGAVVQTETMTARLRVVPPTGEELALEPSGTVAVKVLFRGSSAGLQRVADALSGTAMEVALPSDLIGGGEETLSLERLLMSETRLGQLGVEIVDTEPRTLSLRAIPLVTRAMKIEVDDGGLELSVVPRLTVGEVRVTMPAARAAAMGDGEGVLRVSLAALAEQNLPVGQPLSRELRIEVPEGLRSPWTRLERDTVGVVFTLRERRVQLVLGEVPVFLSIPPSLLERYRVRLAGGRETLETPLTLSGPAGTIGRIRERQARVRAEVRPTAAELEAILAGDSESKLVVSLELPPGVEVVSQVERMGVEVSRVGDVVAEP